MNFTSLIHGAIGALTSSFLPLSSLAHWSQCDKNGRQIVDHAFSHQKRVDLRTRPQISLDKFIRLCERIRGVEVLQWSLDHACMNKKPSSSSSSSSSSSVKVRERYDASGGAMIENIVLEGVHAFSQLLRNNETTIRVLQQDRTSNSNDRDEDSLVESEMSYLIVPVLDAAKLMPNLRVLTLASDMKFQAQPVIQGENRFRPYESQRRFQFALLSPKKVRTRIEAGMNYKNGEVHEDEGDDSHEEDEAVKSEAEGVGTNHSSPYSELRVFDSVLEHTEVSRLFQVTPKANACELIISASNSNQNVVMNPNLTIESSETPLRDHTIRFSMPVTAGSIPQVMCQTMSQSLLYLAIDLPGGPYQMFPQYTRVELRLPHCRELIFNTSWIGISDVSFVCPELTKADIQCVCLAPPDQQLEDEAEERVYQSIPPSILQSLKHCTKLQYLVCFTLGQDVIDLDLTPLLSEEQKSMMAAKAAALNQPSPFDAMASLSYSSSAESEKRRVWRIFYYALSLLPCAQHLKFIDDVALHLSFREYFTLFPNVGIISIIPMWSSRNETVWLRPIGTEDFMSYQHGTEMMTSIYESEHAKKFEQQFEEADDGHAITRVITNCTNGRSTVDQTNANSYFHFASSSVHLTLDVTQLFLSTGRLTHLHYLFLHSPTQVDSAALSMLFRESRSLAHATLWQLRGVDNSVFISLDSECIVRSSLVTLRIKSPCHTHLDNTLNENVLEHLTRLFPSIEHFEFLTPLDFDGENFLGIKVDSILAVPISASESTDVSSRLAWPRLRELSVNHYDGSGNRSLQTIIRTRLAICPLPPHVTFYLRCFMVSPDTPCEEIESEWQVRSADRAPTSFKSASFGNNLIVHHYHECSCDRELCEIHMRELEEEQGEEEEY